MRIACRDYTAWSRDSAAAPMFFPHWGLIFPFEIAARGKRDPEKIRKDTLISLRLRREVGGCIVA
jgi:hypothetical protein